MKSFVLFILILSLGSSVYALTTVEFIEGNLQIKDGTVWRILSQGDKIPHGAIIWVSKESVVELNGEKSKFTLTKPGIYLIGKIVLNSTRNSNAQSFIMNSIRRLFGRRVTSRTPTLGVRASEAPQEGFNWSNDEYADYLKSGKEQLKKKDYSKAQLSFSDALDNAFEDSEEEESRFYLAYVTTLLGNTSRAFTLIKDLSPEPDAPYYYQAVLLKANLLIENFAADEAISWIKAHKANTVSVTESLILLEGLGYLQLGKTEKARDLFQQAVEHYPGSESAEVAKEYLSAK